VAVDDRVIEEVMRLSGATTKRQAIEVALTEYSRRKRLEELAQLAGSGLVAMDEEDLERWRAASAGEKEP
jgi:Arc/MetJ family transcription regulator